MLLLRPAVCLRGKIEAVPARRKAAAVLGRPPIAAVAVAVAAAPAAAVSGAAAAAAAATSLIVHGAVRRAIYGRRPPGARGKGRGRRGGKAHAYRVHSIIGLHPAPRIHPVRERSAVGPWCWHELLLLDRKVLRGMPVLVWRHHQVVVAPARA